MAGPGILSRLASTLTSLGTPGAELPQDVMDQTKQALQNRSTAGRLTGDDVPPDVVKLVADMVNDFVGEWKDDWEHWARQTINAQNFYRGEHYTVWNAEEGRYYLLDETLKKDDIAPTQHKVNVFQALVVTVMSFLSANGLHLRFGPRSARKDEDIVAAEYAEDLVEMFEQNNDMDERVPEWALYLATGGTAGLKLEFLEEEQDDDVEIKEMGEDPETGETMVLDSFTVKEGREYLRVVNPVFLRRPPWAQSQRDFPYLIWDEYIHISEARKRYPWIADKIGTKGTASRALFTNDPSDEFLSTLKGSSMDDANLVQVKHAWLRPHAYLALSTKKSREQLAGAPATETEPATPALFPNDTHWAWCDGEFACVEEESMDAVWEISHALPESGQLRFGYAWSMIDGQRIANDIVNMVVQAVERGLPIFIYNKRLGLGKALRNRKSTPGDAVGVVMESSDSLPNQTLTTPPATISPQGTNLADNLTTGPLMNLLSGVQNAFMGGPMQNADTLGQYKIAVNQSAGRLQILWRAMTGSWARLAAKLVRFHWKYRVTDTVFAKMGPSGSLQKRTITRGNLKGDIRAYPEAADSYPMTWDEKVQRYQQMFENPAMAQIVMDPVNADLMVRYGGVPDMIIPTREAARKQWREIEDLREDPNSAPVDPETDDHPIEAAICRTWINSREGQKAKVDEPGWYGAVKQHYATHVQAQQPQMPPPGAPGSPPGPPGPPGPPPGGPPPAPPQEA